MAEGSRVIGYYTLSSYTIGPTELPAELARKLLRYPNLPATLLGCLTVDTRYHKQRIGEELLFDALHRSLHNTSELASLAVVVEAENDNVIAFYKRYGSIQYPDHPHKLFMTMETIKHGL